MRQLAAQQLSDFPAVSPEAVNRWTHAAGFAASLPAAAVLMIVAARIADPVIVAGFGVYCMALAGLYAASALSHGFEERPRVRKAFRTADQVCIYLMIAGTFTPFAAAYLRTPFGLAQLGGMWLLALVGIVLRIQRRGALIGPLDVAFCLLMGWIPLFSLGEIFSVAGIDGLGLILVGGAFYSGGTVFLLNDHRNPYLHGVWHLATLAGTACHYAFLLFFVALA
ncbi:MAG: hemolysin III family protein [Planctomycetota bacterium]|nr:hemolysin III family protein [Planctomycetaceae bacterium]MDQ3331139.1 hemolysin III family protein [Planctomycetota bacterium]